MNASTTLSGESRQPPQPQAAPRLSTDAPTRMFHWLFALSFTGAYLTADSESWRLVHVTLGYGFAGLVLWRFVYGVIGPTQSRLSLLWRKLSGLAAWLKGLYSDPMSFGGRARQGQNLAMALTIAVMLGLVLPLTLSGYATYNEWGGGLAEDALEELHELLGNAFLVVAIVHLGLLALLSLLRQKNMARPMLSGRLDGVGPSPIQHNRAWLAVLILTVWTGFVIWHLQSEPQNPLNAPSSQRWEEDD